MQNKYLSIIFGLLFIPNLWAKDTENQQYSYIRISECNIPIHKKYTLNEKIGKYEYRYSSLTIQNALTGEDSSLAIFLKNKNMYKEVREFINTWDSVTHVSEEKYKGFLLIKYISKVLSNKYENNYYIFSKDSVIAISNSTDNEINYIMDYCKLHPSYLVKK